jgi:hypothetical protein
MTEILASLFRDGNVVAERVRVDLTAEGNDSAHWYGSVRVGAQVALPLEAICSLTLEDGRRLEIQITRLAYGGPADPVRAHFRGTGRRI